MFMGRRERIDRLGAIYHVIQRGNNKEYIFKDELDKGYIISLLKQYKEGLQYRVLGFVLMSNHYHIMIQPLNANLQVIFHRINSSYGRYYNHKYERSGHVFQGRYKSIIVNDESYLLGLLRYIHQNPVKANMVKKIEDYKWSSDLFYRTNICNKLVDIEIILGRFNKSRKQAIIQYREFMDKEHLEESDDYETVKFIGDEKNTLFNNDLQSVKTIKSLEILLKETGASIEEYRLILEGSRKRSLTPLKASYIQAARELNYTLKEIGEFISISPESVHEMMKRVPVKRVP